MRSRVVLMLGVGLLAIPALAPASAHRDLQWKTHAPPFGIATDSHRHVFVAENPGRDTAAFVEEFGASGRLIHKFGNSGPNALNYAGDVAADSSGRVFVTDTNAGCVNEYDSSGKLIRQLGNEGSGPSLLTPYGIATDSHHHVFISDAEFGASGSFIRAWGARGNAHGEFKAPHGLATDSRGHLYVADSGNDRIQEFDSSGNFIREIGKRSGLDFPRGVAVDPSGRLFVVNPYQVRVFGSRGRFVGVLGRFDAPADVAVGREGRVFVSDTNAADGLSHVSFRHHRLPGDGPSG